MKNVARKKDPSTLWHEIFHSGKILTDKEADEIGEEIKKLRKERKGFRI